MEKVNSYKKILLSAVASTVLVVIFLIQMIGDDDGKGSSVILQFGTIALAIISSLNWIKGAKQYIDFAINEKLIERKIVEIAVQEKIKKLEEKE